MNKTFIIAEVGINHNGSIDLAKKLIDVAKEAGCNAVKFQKRTIDKVYTKEELDKYRESPWGTTNRQQKEGLEFSLEQYQEIDRYCKEKNIHWFASPWDIVSLQFLDQFNLKYMKLASALMGHSALVQEIANRKLHTFISTGMCTLAEIDTVVEEFKLASCPFELMHCNSQYPMPDSEANLRMIHTLKQRYNCNIGYSGHEVGLIVSVAAVALGATSIERHVTLDRSMYGSDQSASVEPQGLKKLVEYIRVVEDAMGEGRKIVTDAEWKSRSKLWRTSDATI